MLKESLEIKYKTSQKSQKNVKTQKHKKRNKIKNTKNEIKLRNVKKKSIKVSNVLLNILSTNAAGLKHKASDLKEKVKYFNSAIFAVQETEYKRKGSFKMANYVIFEANRKNREKGGTMLGIHVNLQPVLISEYEDTFELIVVEIQVPSKSIRVITGYGPQETWDDKDRLPFFTALEKEITSAELEGKSTIIAMDANSKLGPNYIEDDPHPQSKNGTVLAGIVDRHAMCVVNGVKEKRKGLITRKRITVNKIEESIIDFVIISKDLIELIDHINIDDERINVLTKNIKTKDGTVYTESDHNVITTQLKITWCANEYKTVEVFVFKDKKAKEMFKHETSKTKELSKIIDSKKPVHLVTKHFLKRVKGFIHKCFKKVKILQKPDDILEKLYSKRRILRMKQDQSSKDELEKVENELAEKYSENMYKKIMDGVSGFGDSEEGGFNSGQVWKLKKRLSPRPDNTPSAMHNSEGKLLTQPDDILNEAVNHYKNVFKERQIVPEYENYKIEREKLAKKRIEECKKIKTPPWTFDDVKFVMKNLKSGKSQDPYCLPNEIFKPNVAGEDLILAVTKLMNRIKSEIIFPTPMEMCNVTNLYKNKGDRSFYNSYRGIFRTPVLRNILDKLMYNEEYPEIDSNISDSNVGCRKNRNVRDNLFVMNAVMNEGKKNSKEPLDINVYDAFKCFDSLWLSESINDLYDSGLRNDKLALIYSSNTNANIAIKTSSGITERFNIQKIVMQGTVWSGLMCTNTMDKLCKFIYKDQILI